MRLGSPAISGKYGLLCQQNYAYADKNDCKPAAAIYVFAQEELCGGSIADIGERGRGGGGEREVDDREGVEHGEEVEGHAECSGEEERAGEDGADGAEIAAQTGAGAEVVEVSEAAHGGSNEDLAGDSESGNGEDSAP